MNGAAARLLELDAIADNLANINTPGHKAQRPVFASMLAQERDGVAPAIDQVHVVASGSALDLSPGRTNRTENPMDVVPEGKGFLAVQREDGSTAYTRNGQLRVAPTGLLSIGDHPVLDVQGRPLSVPPGRSVEVLADGQVKAGEGVLGQLGLFELAGPLDRLGSGLISLGKGSTATRTASAFRPGELELSNVNPLEATVALVTSQRSYDNAMTALTTYRRMDDKLAEIGRSR